MNIKNCNININNSMFEKRNNKNLIEQVKNKMICGVRGSYNKTQLLGKNV